MPYRTLRALIFEKHPDATISQLTKAADVPNGRLAHWFKPSTKADDMPPTKALKEIARIVGLPLRDVAEACANDCDIPWGPDTSFEGEVKRLSRTTGVDLTTLWDIANDPEVVELVRTRRRIAPDRRESLNLMAMSLAGGPAPDLFGEPEDPAVLDRLRYHADRKRWIREGERMSRDRAESAAAFREQLDEIAAHDGAVPPTRAEVDARARELRHARLVSEDDQQAH